LRPGIVGFERLQADLPLIQPQSFPGVPPGLAFNIGVSFVTYTNWPAYAGETTLSHFSHMVQTDSNWTRPTRSPLTTAVNAPLTLTRIDRVAEQSRGQRL
jgi:hypothetical protein